MNKTEAKRQREKRMVREMIALYCRRNHGTRGGALSPMPGAGGLYGPAVGKVPLYGDQDLLLQLPGSLL